MNCKISSSMEFDRKCTRCSRIVSNLREVRKTYPNYHAGPVPSFGVTDPQLFIVGLGPGMHGANATGRPFTGDHAGILLYKMLHEFGFSNKPNSQHINDGLKLKNCRITNAVKCLPPKNKPLSNEITNCNSFLQAEILSLRNNIVILALGRISHEAIIRALKIKQRDYKFSHNTIHKLESNRFLLDSYHCSRYNTQTRRLTENMFRSIFETASKLIHG